MMFWNKMGWLHLGSECWTSLKTNSKEWYLFLSGSSGKSSLSFSQINSSKCSTFWFSTEPPRLQGRLRYQWSTHPTLALLYFWKISLWFKKCQGWKSKLIITISAMSHKRWNSIKKKKVQTALKWFMTPWTLQWSWQKDKTLKHNSCLWRECIPSD